MYGTGLNYQFQKIANSIKEELNTTITEEQIQEASKGISIGWYGSYKSMDDALIAFKTNLIHLISNKA